ncbi:FAD/NAD(P)-binding protein [Granulicella sp. dw_53]|uniref:FAD/NAD(P)-binding protein n=1 Tax=Granulicella sp. dw_53 TaxID=2719792 RepID=UPI001BD6A194|nr:FAD/NAD(P)-binding protein [Granulicella sp. dw_53]
MTRRTTTRKTVAIIGGGVSGALTALHLTQQHVQARIVVIDPRAELGLGLAYSTPSLRHLLNVPAAKISALPDDPNHFLTWLRANHDASATHETFAPRAVFGRYIQTLFAEAKNVEHIQTSAINLRLTETSGITAGILDLQNGQELPCDFAILATGNFDPAPLPGINDQLRSTSAYHHNAWRPETYANLAPDAPVTLIGSGLTAVDVLLRLRELGHRGAITAVSRHGILPNRHAGYTPLADSAIPPGTPATSIAYLRALRTTIRNGAEWRAAIDSLRASTNDLWLALPLAEQKRFRRHLQHRWDVVRHRMAPPIADTIDRELANHTLILRAGNLSSVEIASEGAAVTILTPHGPETFNSARVINCTGPSMNYKRVNSPLFNSLFEQGLVTQGPLGSGFNTTHDGAMIGRDGNASTMLFTLGPTRLGTLLESIAVPEIRQQSNELATLLSKRIAASEKYLQPRMPLIAPRSPMVGL